MLHYDHIGRETKTMTDNLTFATFEGKQEDIASIICWYLWGKSIKATENGIVGFIRIQRDLRGNEPFLWRGFWIDPTPRHCKCKIESLDLVNRFRWSIGLEPLR